MIGHAWRRLIRFSFRLLYNEFAFSYDAVSTLVSLGRWRSWQRSVLQELDSGIAGPVLELAHGAGNLQLDLLNSGYRTVALDLSPTMGQIARRKLAKHGLATDFVRGDALTLPFRDECCAAIVCTFPTNFITHASSLSEMHRVLKADGRAIVVLSGYLTGGGVSRSLIRLLYRLTGLRYDDSTDSFDSGRFADTGFRAELKMLELGDSVVQLLVLAKAVPDRVSRGDSHLEMPSRSC